MADNAKETPACVVVIPAWNEERCIRQTIEEWHRELSRIVGNPFVILVVDDGSTDTTAGQLDALSREFTRLAVIHQPNGGHGSAILTGYRGALQMTPGFVFQTDSDRQFDPADFRLLWERRNESPFILGCRQQRNDPLHRLVITRIARAMLSAFFRVHVNDANIPFRLVSGSYLSNLLERVPAGVFAPNIFLTILAARDGNDLMNIPVRHRGRTSGACSIMKWKLARVCIRCTRELLAFRNSLARTGLQKEAR